MPAKTRRSTPGKAVVEAEAPVAITETSKKAKSSPAKKNKAQTDADKPNKRAKKAQKTQPVDEKTQFSQVVDQISHFGNVIQASTLKTHVPEIIKKQDPERVVKRKAIASEVRRLSGDIDLLVTDQVAPKEVKAKVDAEQKRKEAAVKIMQKKVVKEINTLGDSGVHKLLHNIKGKSKVVKAGAKKPKKMDAKKLQKKTLDELTELVTPTTEHKPSYVKTKLSVKEAKKQIGIEVVKQATVKEIKSLGEKGVMKQVKRKAGKAAK